MQQPDGSRFQVMIVDDEESYRRLVRAMVEKDGHFQVIAEASDGREAVELVDKVSPDLILMDLHMMYMNGFEATRLIMERRPEARVILLSWTRRQSEYSRMAREVGALAFIAKQDLAISALRQVLQS